MSKSFNPNNPKDMKALEKLKKKSKKRANNKELSKLKKEYIFCSLICIVLGLVCIIFIKSTFWRLLLGILLIGMALSSLMVAFEKHFKKNSIQMFVSDRFPNIMACGIKHNVNYNLETNQFVITNIETQISPVFNFSDILKIEVVEDNETKVKYSLAGAFGGDWAFGTIGAILGAKHWSKTKNYCNKLELVVYFKNSNYSNETFEFINKKADKNSANYRNAVSLIKDCYGKFQAMMQSLVAKIKQEPIEV